MAVSHFVQHHFTKIQLWDFHSNVIEDSGLLVCDKLFMDWSWKWCIPLSFETSENTHPAMQQHPYDEQNLYNKYIKQKYGGCKYESKPKTFTGSQTPKNLCNLLLLPHSTWFFLSFLQHCAWLLGLQNSPVLPRMPINTTEICNIF